MNNNTAYCLLSSKSCNSICLICVLFYSFFNLKDSYLCELLRANTKAWKYSNIEPFHLLKLKRDISLHVSFIDLHRTGIHSCMNGKYEKLYTSYMKLCPVMNLVNTCSFIFEHYSHLVIFGSLSHEPWILDFQPTCGRIRSSTLNATCDPNIDLQFATASSLVKMGNWYLLCSEAMSKYVWKENRMKLWRTVWRTVSVQIDPLLLSDILIGSSALTSLLLLSLPGWVGYWAMLRDFAYVQNSTERRVNSSTRGLHKVC